MAKVIPRRPRFVLIGSFLGLLTYGWFFSSTYYIIFDCSNLIPQLKPFVSFFETQKICVANSIIWSTLVVFVFWAITTFILAYIAGSNLWAEQRTIKSDRRAVRLFGCLVPIVIACYYFQGLALGRNGQKFAPHPAPFGWHDILAYAGWQAGLLVTMAGFFFWAVLIDYFGSKTN
jgi:hypothetical protein